MFRIVETDNHGGDYPDEQFVNLPYFGCRVSAQELSDEINARFCNSDYCPRHWKVVPQDYVLKPGFEP